MKNLWRKALPLLLCLVTLLCIAPAVHAAEETPEMRSSENFINVLKEMEGFSATPYWDVNHYSIGYGTTCPNDKVSYYQKNPLTEKEAEEWLRTSLVDYETDVIEYAKKHKLKLKQHQFDALVSFTYNCGATWMGELNGYFNTAVRSGDTGNLFLYGICLYGSSAGNYVLINRRLCEANMYINGVYKAYNKGDAYPSNYKWVFLNGGGAMPRYPIYAFDAKKAPTINIRFSDIPTGKTADGKTFVYEFAGWYTQNGKKVTKADSSLINGEVLYARWKDPNGNVVTLPTGTPVTKQTVTTTSSSSNIRSGPGTYYNLTGTLAKGTSLSLTEIYKVGSTTWGKTNKGWISLSNTNYKPAPEVKLPQTGTVNANDVNYRNKPNGTKKGQYDKGTKVTITEFSDSGTWGKMSNGYWIFLEYVTYDKDKVTNVQLIKKPTKLNYENYKKPLELEGSVVLITYADGRQVAQTIARGDVTDNRTATATKATVTAKYGSKTVSFVINFGKYVPLEITQQPQNTSAPLGKEVRTTLTAKGEGLKYQWHFCNPGSTTWSKSSLTGNSYYVTMKDAISGRKVYCVVSDKYGNSIKSDVVTLTSNILITKQPTNASAVMGGTATTSLTATGRGLKYQWYFKNASATAYSKSSSTGTSYSALMNEKNSGRSIYCIITDEYGHSVKTNVVTLTGKVTITGQPKNAYAPAGKKVTTSVQASGIGLKYQWYICSAGSTTWSKSSLTGPEYYVTMKDSISGRKVYCIVTDQYGNSVKSDVATLSGKLEITQQPANATVAMGQRASTSVVATGSGLKYQWYICNPGTNTWSRSSLTGPEYYVTMKESISGRKVYCIVTDQNGKTVKSKEATLTAKLQILQQPGNASANLGTKVTTAVKAEGAGLTYQWYICNPGTNTWSRSSLTGPEYYVTMKDSTSGRKVYCVITDRHGKSVRSGEAMLTANVKILQQPENVYARLGERVSTTVKAEGMGLTYQWYICAPENDLFIKSSLTGPEYYVTMKDSISGRRAYCVITDMYGKSVKTDVVTMLVPIEITSQPESKSMAMGQRFSTTLVAEGVGLKYQWYICAPGTELFIKSSLTGPEYYVDMKEHISGRRVYCEITDRHGQTVRSDVITLTAVDAVAILRSELEARNAEIVISYLQNSKLPEDSTVAVDVFNNAIAHTGVSTQGDYIYRHIKNLDYRSECEAQGDDYLVTLTYTVVYRTTAEQEAAVTTKVQEILKQLDVYDATDYEKVKAVYDYLCANVQTPALADSLDYSAYGALVKNSAVCNGIATAFYRLMLELDVDTRLIAGTVNSVKHGWNIVAIDGVYYQVDATKDAGFAPADYHCFLKAELDSYTWDAEYTTEEFREKYPMAEADYQ